MPLHEFILEDWCDTISSDLYESNSEEMRKIFNRLHNQEKEMHNEDTLPESVSLRISNIEVS